MPYCTVSICLCAPSIAFPEGGMKTGRAERYSWKAGSCGCPQGDLLKSGAGATQTFGREVKTTPAGSCLRQIWADRSRHRWCLQNCICQISINQIFSLFWQSHKWQSWVAHCLLTSNTDEGPGKSYLVLGWGKEGNGSSKGWCEKETTLWVW